VFVFEQLLSDFILSDNYITSLHSLIFRGFYILLDTMSTGKIITELRKLKAWSQTDLADKSGISRVMIGKYERDEASPSIDAAKKIADALEVSLDALVGQGIGAQFDKKTIARLQDLMDMEESKKNVLFDLIDTYIRDYKAKQAYA
jgi:transcriptional regulator with XRE-family HTH domain